MTEGTGKPTPGTMPKPGPKPGPRPGAGTAKARPAAIPVPVAAPPKNDPSKFGRIEEDGTVVLVTSTGERTIGNWQAGTKEEGLAHFGKRFDDLATEVEVLEARLKAHPEEAAKITLAAQEIRTTLPEATVLGDVEGLDSRLDDIIDNSLSTGAEVAENRAREREEALAAKEKLAAEAEELAENSTDWKKAGDRIRAILDEWRAIKGLDRATDDKLWKRYSRARDAFNRRRGAHFAELDKQRATARKKKEELIERAEALQDSTDWKETGRAYKDLMAEWKAAGRAPRDVDDKLWARFRAAQDHFFGARDAENDARDKEFADNAAAKDALIAEYDSQIKPEDGIEQAKSKLRELQEKWEQIGFVPRNQIRTYEEKIATLEARVAQAEEDQWRRTDPEAQARVAQFQAKVDDFTAQAEEAEKKGNAKKAESLRAQAAQWQEWADTAKAAIDG